MAGLEQEIRKWLNTGDRPKDISTMIDRKYALLRTTYGINFDPIAMSLKKSPDIYNQIDNLSNLELFFRRPIDIALSLADQSEDLWCKDKNCWLTVARYSGRLLVDNPVSKKKESWSRFSSESKRDHLVHHEHSGGRPDKSGFFGNYRYIKPIELAVFDHGVGQLISKDKIRLYGEFEAPIGKSPKGIDVSFACVEIKRKMRPPTKGKAGNIRKTGYIIRGHGYPVGLKDIERDLRGSEL